MAEMKPSSFSATDANGVSWEASWVDGNISYRGIDKNGNVVNAPAPAEIVSAAKAYGASFNSEKGDVKDKKDKSEEKTETAGKKEEEKSNSLSAVFRARPELRQIKIKTNKNGSEVVGYDKNGNEIPLSKEETENIMKAHKESLGKSSFKGLAQAFGRDMKNMTNDLKQDILRKTNDIKNTFKLISQGKFREVVDRAALRIHDNLEAMGILNEKNLSRIAEASKKIEERLGIEERKKNPGRLSQQIGKNIAGFKRLLGLSGRDNSRAVPVSKVRAPVNQRGRDGR